MQLHLTEEAHIVIMRNMNNAHMKWLTWRLDVDFHIGFILIEFTNGSHKRVDAKA